MSDIQIIVLICTLLGVWLLGWEFSIPDYKRYEPTNSIEMETNSKRYQEFCKEPR